MTNSAIALLVIDYVALLEERVSAAAGVWSHVR